jgi:hypothetical protein
MSITIHFTHCTVLRRLDSHIRMIYSFIRPSYPGMYAPLPCLPRPFYCVLTSESASTVILSLDSSVEIASSGTSALSHVSIYRGCPGYAKRT